MKALVSLQEVAVHRSGNRILGPISWDLYSGQRWVVIGPNGAGKTTFLQLIGTFMHPSRGSVEVLGEKLGGTDVFELRTRIGITSSALNNFLPEDERVIDLVLTAAYAIAGRWIEEYDLWDESRAKALLDIFGVRELAERSYGTLSEGERKRVQIARSLMSDPELILLDEPAAALDIAGREDILGRIANYLSEANAPASVIVTHHIEEIPHGTTHALLLNRGAVYAAGPIETVITEENLNGLFGLNMKLLRSSDRYAYIP